MIEAWAEQARLLIFGSWLVCVALTVWQVRSAGRTLWIALIVNSTLIGTVSYLAGVNEGETRGVVGELATTGELKVYMDILEGQELPVDSSAREQLENLLWARVGMVAALAPGVQVSPTTGLGVEVDLACRILVHYGHPRSEVKDGVLEFYRSAIREARSRAQLMPPACSGV